MTQDIKQAVTFDANPVVIFETLMDAKKHAAFSGAPAKIDRKVGGSFTCYGGYINGVNIEVVKYKSIIQAWRAKNWPKGAWSVINYKLASAKGGKTKLSFSHVGVPDKQAPHIAEGWKKSYWDPIKAMIKASAAKPKKKAPAKARKSPARKTKAKARARAA